jgi:hypothetical protein
MASLVVWYGLKVVERRVVKTPAGVIEGTAEKVIAQLAQVPANEHVRTKIGRPGLTVIARRLQARNGDCKRNDRSDSR